MKKEIYILEGIEIEVEKYDKNDKDAERRRLAYCFRMIREKSGMSRTDFSVWLGVPYRTMQEWELGQSHAGICFTFDRLQGDERVA